MREIRLFDSLSGELVVVAPGDAIRVEVRTSPVIARGAVDVCSTRPFVLFSFLERYLQREGFGTKFLFDSPTGGDALYELADEHDDGPDCEDAWDCGRSTEASAAGSAADAGDPAEGSAGRSSSEESSAGRSAKSSTEEDASASESAEQSSAKGLERGDRRPGRGAGGGTSGMGLLPVSRSDVDRWVNVCFGADREGRQWPPVEPQDRVPLNDALKLFGHPAVAFYLLGSHYSQPLGDARAGLANGARHVQRLREAVATLVPGQPSPPDMSRHLQEFGEALADDLDTPNALVAMFEWVLEAERRGGVGDRDLRTMLEMFELDDLLVPN